MPITTVVFINGPLAGKVLAVQGQWSLGDTYTCESEVGNRILAARFMPSAFPVAPMRTVFHTYKLAGWEPRTGYGRMELT